MKGDLKRSLEFGLIFALAVDGVTGLIKPEHRTWLDMSIDVVAASVEQAYAKIPESFKEIPGKIYDACIWYGNAVNEGNDYVSRQSRR